jgi:hypothetical protein
MSSGTKIEDGARDMALYVLVMNTKRHSVEIYCPKKYISNKKCTEKQLIKFADSLMISNLVNVDFEEIKERMIGIDENSYSEEMENLIKYQLMEGKCLDEKRLSYFIPSKIIKKGSLTIDEFMELIKKI